MNDEVIGNLIRKLQGTLDGASSISEKDRKQLEQLSADLQAVLAQPGAVTRVRHQNIIDRLRAAVDRFEASHPDLTAVMAQATETLADMGI